MWALRALLLVQDLAFIGWQNAGHDLEERGFSCPISSNKAHQLATSKGQAEVVDARAGFAAEPTFSVRHKMAEGDAFELERHLHGPTSFHPRRPQA